MKTLELDLPTPVLLVWGLPEDAEIGHYKEDYPEVIHWQQYDELQMYTMPEGDWQLIGRLSKLTEEQASTIVGKNYWDMSTGGYIDYNSEEPTDNYRFAINSFHSAIEAEGYYIMNPYMMPNSRNYSAKQLENDNSDYWKKFDEWQEAQSKTLPENTLIFKRA